MLLSILIFSVMVSFISFLISKKHRAYDRAEIATYMVLVAWGSLMFGMFMSRLDGSMIVMAVR